MGSGAGSGLKDERSKSSLASASGNMNCVKLNYLLGLNSLDLDFFFDDDEVGNNDIRPVSS